jgi:three-Cys-motif partner protein
MKSALYVGREQTEVKHRCIERYLQGATRILGSWSDDLVYGDCCAGPWEAAGERLEDTSFARAVEVLKAARVDLGKRGRHPSIRCLLIEKDEDAFAQLKKYADEQSEIEVVAKHWDFSEHLPEIIRFVKQCSTSFPFVLIDPKGWELACTDVIAPLLRLCPGEVLINLMTSWITRFIDDPSKPFHRALGSEVERLRALAGIAQEQEIVHVYSDLVRKEANFDYVCTLPIMKANQDAFHYYLIYGTRNIRGVEVFKETEAAVIPFMHETIAEAQARRNFERTGQFTLLGDEALYREKRYTSFRIDQLEYAKKRVQTLLKSRTPVAYEDVWGEAMQFAAVLPEDLNEWLQDWERAGQLAIRNRSDKERTYKKHHLLEYRGAQLRPDIDKSA